jgi:hypothetical protein
MSYQFTDENETHIRGGLRIIPVDPDNADYAKIVDEGAIVEKWTDPRTPQQIWADIRSERDSLLAATDWWAVSDRGMSAAEAAYRQALRDVPQTFASPADVVWPTKPA